MKFALRFTLTLTAGFLLLIPLAVARSSSGALQAGTPTPTLSPTVTPTPVPDRVSLDTQPLIDALSAAHNTDFTSDPALDSIAAALAGQALETGQLGSAAPFLNAIGYPYQGASVYATLGSGRLREADLLAQWEEADALSEAGFTYLGIGAVERGGRVAYVLLVVAVEDLTAPGADVFNPGQPTQSGQAAAILDLLNAAREEQGSCPLQLNEQLTAAALRHSEDLSAANILSHTGTDGSSPSERAQGAGYPARNAGVGENVLSRHNLNAPGAFDQWWNSPGHYENMMNPDFAEIGLAYAGPSEDGTYYYTMVLGFRPDATCR